MLISLLILILALASTYTTHADSLSLHMSSIKHYEQGYETITEDEGISFVKYIPYNHLMIIIINVETST